MIYKKLKTKRLSNGEFDDPVNLNIKFNTGSPKWFDNKYKHFEMTQISGLIAYICEIYSDCNFQVSDYQGRIEFSKKETKGPLKGLGPSVSSYIFEDVFPHKNGVYIIENEKDKILINRSLKIKKLLKNV